MRDAGREAERCEPSGSGTASVPRCGHCKTHRFAGDATASSRGADAGVRATATKAPSGRAAGRPAGRRASPLPASRTPSRARRKRMIKAREDGSKPRWPSSLFLLRPLPHPGLLPLAPRAGSCVPARILPAHTGKWRLRGATPVRIPRRAPRPPHGLHPLSPLPPFTHASGGAPAGQRPVAGGPPRLASRPLGREGASRALAARAGAARDRARRREQGHGALSRTLSCDFAAHKALRVLVPRCEALFQLPQAPPALPPDMGRASRRAAASRHAREQNAGRTVSQAGSEEPRTSGCARQDARRAVQRRVHGRVPRPRR